MIPAQEKNLESMINGNGSEINRIEYVFLGTKPRITGKKVLDFPVDTKIFSEMSEARVTERAQM